MLKCMFLHFNALLYVIIIYKVLYFVVYLYNEYLINSVCIYFIRYNDLYCKTGSSPYGIGEPQLATPSSYATSTCAVFFYLK